MTEKQEQLALAENIAAISAVFHASDHYRRFYMRHGEKLGGFPAIWSFCIEAAVIFSSLEGTREDYEWIDAVTQYAESLAKSVKLPTPDTMRELAKTAIKEAA